MIRAEAKDTLWRWRELGLAAALGALGLYWASASYGLIQIIGYALSAVAILLAIIGIQRGRFRNSAQGQGVVTFIEGQITYFGPYSGGGVTIEDMSCISLKTVAGEKSWIIEQPANVALIIPVDAKGADQLFDAFAALPGIKIEYMLAQLSHERGAPVIIWQRDTYLGANKYLH